MADASRVFTLTVVGAFRSLYLRPLRMTSHHHHVPYTGACAGVGLYDACVGRVPWMASCHGTYIILEWGRAREGIVVGGGEEVDRRLNEISGHGRAILVYTRLQDMVFRVVN